MGRAWALRRESGPVDLDTSLEHPSVAVNVRTCQPSAGITSKSQPGRRLRLLVDSGKMGEEDFHRSRRDRSSKGSAGLGALMLR